MWSGILLTCFLPWVLLLCQNFTLRWGPIPACSDRWANKQAKCLHLDQSSWDTPWYIADICLIYCRSGASASPMGISKTSHKAHDAVRSPPLRDVLVTDFVCLPLAEDRVYMAQWDTPVCANIGCACEGKGQSVFQILGLEKVHWVMFLNLNYPLNFPLLHPAENLYLCSWPTARLFAGSFALLLVFLLVYPDCFKTWSPIPASASWLALLSPSNNTLKKQWSNCSKEASLLM